MKKHQFFAALVGAALAAGSADLQAQQPSSPRGTQSPQRTAPGGQAQTPNAEQPFLRTIQLPGYVIGDIANVLGLKYAQQRGVSISADTPRGQLLVMAPRALHAQIDAEVRDMMNNGFVQRTGRQVSTSVISKQFTLRTISWREFEDGLQSLAGRPLQTTTRRNGELAAFQLVDQPIGNATVEVDRRSNSVTVVAPEPTIAGWEQVIASLDTRVIKAGEVMQLARLQNAEPAPIQQAIRLLRNLDAANGETVGVAGNNMRFMNTALTGQEPGGAPAPGGAQPPAGAAQGQGDAVGIVGPDGEEAGGLLGDVQIQFIPELGVLIVRGAKRSEQIGRAHV